MATATGWAAAPWNPTGGCRRVSPGCANCYAEQLAARFAGEGQAFEGLVHGTNTGPRWTGRMVIRRERLAWPLHQAPQVCLVGSLSDVFEDSLPDELPLAVWGVMAALPAWTFQVVTKRTRRARALLERAKRSDALAAARALLDGPRERARLSRALGQAGRLEWPPRNVWLGASVEDQDHANQRLPDLVATPAALRFAVAEPLLGPLSLSRWLAPRRELPASLGAPHGVRWVVAGGEMGPAARPMHPEHVRALRDECKAVGTAFLFKQWGRFAPTTFEAEGARAVDCEHHGRALVVPWNPEQVGRLLDGRLWNETP